MSIERPALYIVATPIGNLDDISYRAVAILTAVDIVFAEDTRLSRRLFDHYAITTETRSLHDHNEANIAAALVARIKSEGLACALVSDAGTPLVSDPGYLLVREAITNDIPVHPVPGACAIVAALSTSGLATDRFVFEGFLPPRHGARVKRLQGLADEARTLVLYEAPHRIEATLTDIGEVFCTQRDIAVARELTKLHETQYRGTVSEVAAAMAADPNATRPPHSFSATSPGVDSTGS
jgi:16S rRNA (cytidine1402-2'-O)-methyltransferase